MNFDFTEEQGMLRDSVARFVQDHYDFHTRNQLVASEAGFSHQNWQTFAELGWLSIPFAEIHGGFGGSVVDTMLIMEQLGQGLVAEPYMASVLLFGGLVEALGSAAHQSALLPPLIAGELQGAFAFLERDSRFNLDSVNTTARLEDGSFIINGEKTMVFNGAAADHFVVSVRTSGTAGDLEGISLLLVDANSKGLEKTRYRVMDGQLVVNLGFSDVKVSSDAVLGLPGAAYPAMVAVTNRCTLALCAEAIGIMGKLNAITVDYTRNREQFGVPIGSFQALQHRMVDTFMAYEQVKSLLYRAVCAELEGSADNLRSLHALKVLVERSAQHIGAESIQLHGGMGLTEEMPVGHYVQRLMMINTMFGDGDYHQQQFTALAYAG